MVLDTGSILQYIVGIVFEFLGIVNQSHRESVVVWLLCHLVGRKPPAPVAMQSLEEQVWAHLQDGEGKFMKRLNELTLAFRVPFRRPPNSYRENLQWHRRVTSFSNLKDLDSFISCEDQDVRLATRYGRNMG